MQHPRVNAEIARLAQAQALRAARSVHRVEHVERVPPQKPDPRAGVLGRLSVRLVPELGLTAPRGAFQ